MKQIDHFIRTDPDGIPGIIEPIEIARVRPARADHVERVLMQPTEGHDGRSDWVWVRLRDGTLMLAVFPEGETYMLYSDHGVCDFYD